MCVVLGTRCRACFISGIAIVCDVTVGRVAVHLCWHLGDFSMVLDVLLTGCHATRAREVVLDMLYSCLKGAMDLASAIFDGLYLGFLLWC